jgi:hypothetical protein
MSYYSIKRTSTISEGSKVPKNKDSTDKVSREPVNYPEHTKITQAVPSIDTGNQVRRYNEGSVYRQASRFNPYLSSSTNISSSISGSVEVIVSDLEEHIDSQSKHELSQLNEASDENSEDPETLFIQNIINQKKNLCELLNKEEELDKARIQLLETQQTEKKNKQKTLQSLKLQILQALGNK